MAKLEPFDPSRPLKATSRFVRIHGTTYRKGEAVPYNEADDRILKRLYDLRRIGYGDGRAVERRTPRERFLDGNTERAKQESEAGERAEDTLAAELVKAHSKAELLEMAGPTETDPALEGVTDKQTKGEIALALVRAGRGPA